MTITIAKAAPIGSQEIPDVEIHIGPGLVPNYFDKENWERVYKTHYTADAAKIMDAMQSLPGGTWDRLLCLMLEKRASILRVPAFEVQVKDPTPLTRPCPACGKDAHFSREGVILPHRPPFGKFANCRGVVEEVSTPPKQSVTSGDFPTALQVVMFAAENHPGITFNEGDTAALAAEIRKLLGRP